MISTTHGILAVGLVFPAIAGLALFITAAAPARVSKAAKTPGAARVTKAKMKRSPYSISISGNLPDPSGGNTYCFEPDYTSEGTWNEYVENTYSFSVTATGVGSTDYISTFTRIYTENYNSSDTYTSDEAGPGNLSVWPIAATPGSSTLNVSLNTDNWFNFGGWGTPGPYDLYGVEVIAYLYSSSGTILASTTWQSWNDGAIKIDHTTHSPNDALISGWYTFNNSTQQYYPYYPK